MWLVFWFWCSQSVHIIHTNPVGFSLVKKENRNDAKWEWLLLLMSRFFSKKKKTFFKILNWMMITLREVIFFPVIIRFHSYLPTLFFCSFGVAIIKKGMIDWFGFVRRIYPCTIQTPTLTKYIRQKSIDKWNDWFFFEENRDLQKIYPSI